eukprot:TRINITY_DN71211_c0_g1_i1.p1 TRINITY_DN71211_c0_g1~~TRINITY_DN71211_c0_g1_i1.p1  ORF type:complete len:391 (-),score=28.76 TRINITY_DN71211_c0_g1_i1:90-1220(-)
MRERRPAAERSARAQLPEDTAPACKPSRNATFSPPRVCRTMLQTAALAGCLMTAVAFYLRTPAPKVSASDIEKAGNHWVKLKDGRLIEYSKCGDPRGAPVYAATGYASTASLYVAPWMCKLYEKHGLLMMGVSMPGFGLSDSMPVGFKRSLLDWPQDVLAIMEKEGVKNFAIFGVSTGCVHGVAVANAVPERITGMVLSTPTAPVVIEATCDGTAKETAILKKIMVTPYAGDLLAKLMSMLSAKTQISAAPDIKAAMEKMVALGGKYTERIDAYRADIERASSHTYRGWTDNMHTIMDDIPFSLSDLGGRLSARGTKVGITTAPDDTTNPPAMQAWFHSQLKGSKLLQFEAGWGHVHLFGGDNYDTMLKFLPGNAG